MTGSLLCIEDLTMRFGGLTAVDDLSFNVAPNEITAIIGPNGAGKTTVFNCLTGFYRPTSGKLKLTQPNGKKISLERMNGYAIARHARVVRTFQNIRLFAGMSVLENLMIAQHVPLMRASLYSIGGLLGLARYQRAEREAVELASYWLEKVNLIESADEAAGSLSYGARRRLEIARAMCASPLLLCLDEPAAGLNPHEDMELCELLADIRREYNIAILLIEHDMGIVMRISDHIVVLDHGACIADGKPAEVRANPAVIRAYLGEPAEDDVQVQAGGE
jgi:branched-chain amino acid transport system ATP-binding protein